MDAIAKNKPRILIFDDDVNFLKLTSYILNKNNYDVISIESIDNLEHARQLIHTHHPDLIFCDIHMEPDGFKIHATLVEDPQLKKIPFFFVTRTDDLPNQIRAYLEGAYDYIIKPFDETILLAKIQGVLRRHKSLNDLIYLDPLTNLYNRRFFEDELERQIALHRRNNNTFSLFLLDIDFFKKINDTYGHNCGDNTLVAFADFIKANTRKSDIFARWGGEEFFLLMLDSEKEGALKTVSNLITKITASPLLNFQGTDINVSFSAGLAQYPNDGITSKELVVFADKGLYYAKENGRSQVATYPK